MGLLPGVLTGLSVKAAAGLTVAAAAAGGGVAATVATHSPDPVVWGQAVVRAVQGCRAQDQPTPGTAPSPGAENVGRCVSAFARQKGQRERQLHSRATDHPSANPGAGHGRPGSLPAPPGHASPGSPPTGSAHGRPGSLPAPSGPGGPG